MVVPDRRRFGAGFGAGMSPPRNAAQGAGGIGQMPGSRSAPAGRSPPGMTRTQFLRTAGAGMAAFGAAALGLGGTARAQAAVPATWYVSNGGNDSNPGTQEAPFATIQHAVDVANPGDTIMVGPGEFKGAAVNKRLNLIGNGAEGPGATVVNVHSDWPLSPANTPFACIYFYKWSVVGADASGSSITGFRFEPPTDDVWFPISLESWDFPGRSNTLTGVTISDNYIIYDYGAAIANWDVRGLVIKNNILVITAGEGVAFFQMDESIIQNNSLKTTGTMPGSKCFSMADCRNNLVQGNTIEYSGPHGAIHLNEFFKAAGLSGVPCINNTFLNNTVIVDQPGPTEMAGIYISPLSASNTFQSNTMQGSATQGVLCQGSGNSFSGNDFSGLKAAQAQVNLGSGAHDNQFLSNSFGGFMPPPRAPHDNAARITVEGYNNLFASNRHLGALFDWEEDHGVWLMRPASYGNTVNTPYIQYMKPGLTVLDYWKDQSGRNTINP